MYLLPENALSVVSGGASFVRESVGIAVETAIGLACGYAAFTKATDHTPFSVLKVLIPGILAGITLGDAGIRVYSITTE